MHFRLAPFLCLATVLLTLPVHAQIQVDIAMKRSLFILHEPILATVTITNLSGGEVTFEDTGVRQWFGFEVERMDGRPLPPSDASYTNQPLQLGTGQKISRTVNLTPLYPFGEFGGYRIRAAVNLAASSRYFTSPNLNIEITEGRVLWKKTVGVPQGAPGGGSTRTVTLLSHRLPESTQLYLRIEDDKSGTVYCTHKLGRFLTFGKPSILLDEKNQVHILQNIAPKNFIYSHIGLNGEVIQRKTYNEFGSRPALRRTTEGGVALVGGQVYDPSAPLPEQALPTLSDRPVPLPTSGGTTKKDDKRPENLLSQ